MNKDKLNMMLALSGMAMIMSGSTSGRLRDSDDEKQVRIKLSNNNDVRHKGLLPFDYGVRRIVWAINKKNADRKAKLKGWF